MLFFTIASVRILLFYVAAAILPAAFLLRYVYRRDTIEKEPAGLLLVLIAFGVVSALCAGVLEYIGTWLLSFTLRSDSPFYTVVFAFLVVAVAEEGAKLFFLHRRTWRDPNFSHLFDGVVYSAFVSLGFAAFENIKYVFSYGLSVALPRAILAIPGHLGFSVFMGVFYGYAKRCELQGNPAGRKRNLLLGYLLAVFLHGIYDACAMTGTAASMLLFFLFVVVMYVVVYRVIKHASATDQAL